MEGIREAGRGPRAESLPLEAPWWGEGDTATLSLRQWTGAVRTHGTEDSRGQLQSIKLWRYLQRVLGFFFFGLQLNDEQVFVSKLKSLRPGSQL